MRASSTQNCGRGVLSLVTWEWRRRRRVGWLWRVSFFVTIKSKIISVRIMGGGKFCRKKVRWRGLFF